MASGFCPGCGRGLANIQKNGKGSCRQHGHIWADWEDPLMVVDEETDTVIGFYTGTDADTLDIAVKGFDGSFQYIPRLYSDVLRSSEIEGGDW